MPRKLPKTTRCQNCGTPTRGNYCPECGQDCREHRVSLRILLGDLWAELFTFDSRFLRSLVPLLARPGELTREYISGRRARYIPPLRLFLFITILLFLLVSIRVNPLLEAVESEPHVVTDSVRVAETIAALTALPESLRSPSSEQLRDELARALAARRVRPDAAAVSRPLEVSGDESSSDAVSREPRESTGLSFSLFRRGVGGRTKVMNRDVTGSETAIIRGAIRIAPKLVFLLLPVFAALLALVYVRSRRMFIEHLVFSLHYHAALFLGFAVAALSGAWLVWLLVPPVGGVYVLLAMKRVYRQSWRKTLLKHAFLTAVYGFVFISFMALIMGSSAYLLGLAERHPWIWGWLAG